MYDITPLYSMHTHHEKSENSYNSYMERILIVDDDKYMCKSLAYVLKNEGYGVDSVTDGNSALNMLVRKEFDLVLLDYKLSGVQEMNGLWVYEKVKEVKPSVKAIMISGYGDSKVKEKARELGVKYFIDKPFLIRNLLTRVRTALAK